MINESVLFLVLPAYRAASAKIKTKDYSLKKPRLNQHFNSLMLMYMNGVEIS